MARRCWINPPEAGADFAAVLRTRAIDLIVLLAPTTTEWCFGELAARGSGCVYDAPLTGVTGAGNLGAAAVVIGSRTVGEIERCARDRACAWSRL